MARLALLVVLIAGLAAPATAQSPVRYEGRTSQGFSMKIWATPEGDITEIRMHWRAPCRVGKYVRDGTRWPDPIEQSGNQMSDSGTYRVRDPNGIRLIVYGRLAGTFEPDRGGEGTARYTVRVRRRGRLIDRCRSGRITWSVARSG